VREREREKDREREREGGGEREIFSIWGIRLTASTWKNNKPNN
jgi:RNA-binding protein 39